MPGLLLRVIGSALVVGFAAGGIGVATGVTLLVMGLSHKKHAESAAVTPWVGLRSAGLSGRF